MLTDQEVLALYREFSEESYAAGFMSPYTDVIQGFRGWLKERLEPMTPGSMESYEREMLVEYRRQEVDGGV